MDVRALRVTGGRGIAFAAIYLLLAQAIMTGLTLGAGAGWSAARLEQAAQTYLCAARALGEPAPSDEAPHRAPDLCCASGCPVLLAAVPPPSASVILAPAHTPVASLRPYGAARTPAAAPARWRAPRGPPVLS